MIQGCGRGVRDHRPPEPGRCSGEKDAMINRKVTTRAFRGELTTNVCVGETWRTRGKETSRCSIAARRHDRGTARRATIWSRYEPVWAMARADATAAQARGPSAH